MADDDASMSEDAFGTKNGPAESMQAVSQAELMQ